MHIDVCAPMQGPKNKALQSKDMPLVLMCVQLPSAMPMHEFHWRCRCTKDVGNDDAQRSSAMPMHSLGKTNLLHDTTQSFT